MGGGGPAGRSTSARRRRRSRTPLRAWPSRARQTVRMCRNESPDRPPPILFLFDLKVLGRGLAAIAHQLEFHPLALVERGQPRPLHGRDVNEHILAAVGGLNEPVALGGIEPFHCSARHSSLLSSTVVTTLPFPETDCNSIPAGFNSCAAPLRRSECFEMGALTPASR